MALAIVLLVLVVLANWGPLAAGSVAVLAYVVVCTVWPFSACKRCDGAGKFRSPSGRAWRTCRKCKGTGQRLRNGQRLINLGNRTYEKGSK